MLIKYLALYEKPDLNVLKCVSLFNYIELDFRHCFKIKILTVKYTNFLGFIFIKFNIKTFGSDYYDYIGLLQQYNMEFISIKILYRMKLNLSEKEIK